MSWKNLYLITKRSKITLKAVGKERWDFATFLWFILTIKNQSTKLHEDTNFFSPLNKYILH